MKARPLGFLENQMHITHSFQSSGTIVKCMRLQGEVKPQQLRVAIANLHLQHAPLRAQIREMESVPWLVINDALPPPQLRCRVRTAPGSWSSLLEDEYRSFFGFAADDSDGEEDVIGSLQVS